MNKVILIGRLTKDPELRRTPTDVPVVQFVLAVNRTFQSANGERQADFINCIAWRNQAENLARYIKKGGLVAVDGSIQTRSYDDQNGVRRYVTEVICNQINFLEPKKDNSSFTDFNQTQPYNNSFGNNYNQNNPYNNYSNQGYNNQGYNQKGYNQNNQSGFGRNNQQQSYNEFDQSQPESSSSPFEELSSDNFDVSDDDLPF